MKYPEKPVIACGEDFFCSLFRQAGCAAVRMEEDIPEIIKKMKKEKPLFFIFSQNAFEKIKKEFRENYAGSPYIVFPLPGEENRIEKAIADLVKIAVGVEL